MKLLIWI